MFVVNAFDMKGSLDLEVEAKSFFSPTSLPDDVSPGTKRRIEEFLDRLDGVNYPSLKCPERECNWWEFCDNTKWFWQGDRQNDSVQKLREYCRFKRLLNDAYYRELVDGQHARTVNRIDAESYVRVHGVVPMHHRLKVIR